MLSQRTLAVLAALCLAVSLVARLLDQRALDAHAAALAAISAVPDPSAPSVRAAVADRIPTICTTICTLSHNTAMLDAISIASLVLGLGFALTALWKHVK
ncbi:hypothetical protein [Novosphingobium terrae]|jgi:hypothetical protein|uniref:hypothetical protein n=1 Tax=Novosphingobium terrae TaxID=2726189 RepID=UPI00197DB79F|nr:hypothetical protein [Novosphingobium terrae]